MNILLTGASGFVGRNIHAALRAAGCTVLDRYDETEQGKFGYVQDPEGAVVELWQPAADDAG